MWSCSLEKQAPAYSVCGDGGVEGQRLASVIIFYYTVRV